VHKFYVSLLSAVELGEWSWMHIIENQSSNLQHFICPHCRGFLPNVFGLYSAECGIALYFIPEIVNKVVEKSCVMIHEYQCFNWEDTQILACVLKTLSYISVLEVQTEGKPSSYFLP
jgi:hypothetical protein